MSADKRTNNDIARAAYNAARDNDPESGDPTMTEVLTALLDELEEAGAILPVAERRGRRRCPECWVTGGHAESCWATPAPEPTSLTPDEQRVAVQRVLQRHPDIPTHAELVGLLRLHGLGEHLARVLADDILGRFTSLLVDHHELQRIATEELPHAFEGMCPDSVDGHDRRDPACPACQVLIRSGR